MKVLRGLILVLLFACGPTQDQVELSIVSPIAVKSPQTLNPGKAFLGAMNITLGTDCYQDQMQLVVYDINKKMPLATKPIKLRTRFANPTPITPLTYGNSSSDVAKVINRLKNVNGQDTFIDEPLSILVPKTIPVEVGIIGTFFDPIDNNSDGICDQWSTTPDLSFSSTQLFGHAPVTTANLNGTPLALSIDVLHTNPTIQYSLGTNPARYRDWVQLNAGFFPEGITRLEAGPQHVCAITRIGSLYCWGNNLNGQIGTGSASTSYSSPFPVFPNGVTDVSLGLNHTCAIRNNQVYCWGNNNFYQTGSNTAGDIYTPTIVTFASPYTKVEQLSTGDYHNCTLVDQKVFCWGYNSQGQLGNGTNSNSSSPVWVSSSIGTGITHLSAGGSHTCAIKNGAAYCWGSNSTGQLGINSYTAQNQPSMVNGFASGTQLIEAGVEHSCGIQNGILKCWGKNDYGQLGDGTTTNRTIPTTVSGSLSNLRSLSLGYSHTCALTGIKPYCWGSNQNNNIDSTATTQFLTPTQLNSITISLSKTISAGDLFTCTISPSGVFCWGQNANGEFGNSTTSNTPTHTPSLISDFQVNHARLKSIRYLKGPDFSTKISIHLDSTNSQIGAKYYVPHLGFAQVRFNYTGNISSGGCLNAGSCNGIYEGIINVDENPSINFETYLIQTISGNPPAIIKPNWTSTFYYEKY